MRRFADEMTAIAGAAIATVAIVDAKSVTDGVPSVEDGSTPFDRQPRL